MYKISVVHIGGKTKLEAASKKLAALIYVLCTYALSRAHQVNLSCMMDMQIMENNSRMCEETLALEQAVSRTDCTLGPLSGICEEAEMWTYFIMSSWYQTVC